MILCSKCIAQFISPNKEFRKCTRIIVKAVTLLVRPDFCQIHILYPRNICDKINMKHRELRELKLWVFLIVINCKYDNHLVT